MADTTGKYKFLNRDMMKYPALTLMFIGHTVHSVRCTFR